MKKKTPFLGFFLLFLVSSFLTISVISDGNPGEDVAAMQSFSEALGAEKRLGWTDPNPCNWKGVSCSNGVTAIQIGNTDLEGGTLSVSLGDLKNLNRLEVQNCSLKGPLPSLKNLSNLQVLLLHTNNFTSIPPDFFSGLTSLQSVTLDNNKDLPNWEISDGLRQCSNLVNFSATSANINGSIPEFLGSDFASLEHLGLAYNYLEGALPASFGGSGMKSLWLNNQQGTRLLSGPITVVQNMTSLVQVWLHDNNFTGPLPDFSGLISLEDLEVRDNQLTGIVPDSLIKLTSLKKVLLKNNLLQGPVPKFASSIENDGNSSNGNRFCSLEPDVSCDPRVNDLLLVLKPLNYPARLAKSWQGNDPCNNWLGISCDQGNITVINFQRMGLLGTISPDFALFTSLKSLILADNNLTGSIPAELTELPNLELLNVENNELTGEVPVFKHTRLGISGNPGLLNGSSPSPHDSPAKSNPSIPPGAGSAGRSNDKKSSMSVGAIIGFVCGAVALILLFLVGGYCYYKSKHQFGVAQTPSATVIHPRHSGSDPEMIKITVAGSSINGGTASESLSQGSDGRRDIQFVEAGNMVISIQVLRTITNNFSEENILGRGGFGTVYKGNLHDGTVVAVKRMESGMITAKGLDEFKSEIAVLTKVRHRHLVSLLWYCLDGNERILVYEYMPQGTLSRYIFNWKEEELQPLDWKKRLSIALDVARGVEYLHSLAHQSFIHRDLKPSNILLGDDLRAKVSDFGLVRPAPDGKVSLVTRLAGTFGYLAPEYAATGRVTTKVDIFSFGVILMELITGRRAIEESLPEESMYLVTWFRRMLISKESIQKVIDPTIDLTEDTLASISTVAELAGHCCVREPLQRPDMGHAVNVLSSLVDVWKPTEPDSDDIYGIDLEQTLPEALEKWRAYEGTSSFLSSLDNTQTSIPTRPPGFESFTSTDGR